MIRLWWGDRSGYENRREPCEQKENAQRLVVYGYINLEIQKYELSHGAIGTLERSI